MAAVDDFLRAISANPDDDAPRLIFADWLDENEQPERADFIRGQIQLAQLHDNDPDRLQLIAKTKRLWQRFRNQWVGALPKSVFEVLPHRGFVETAVVRYDRIDALSELLQTHPVRELILALRPNERSNRTRLEQAEAMPQLVEQLQRIPEVKRLRKLTVRPSVLYYTNELFLQVADRLSALTELESTFSVVPSENPHSRRPLRAFAQHPITSIHAVGDDSVLKRLAEERWPRLVSLRLPYSHFSVIGVRELVEAPWAKQLEVLDLSSCGLRPEAIRLLVEQRWERLHTLNLSTKNWINREAARMLLSSNNFPALRHLDLGDSDLYDDDITALADLPLLQQLRSLSLRRNAITEHAALALAESASLGQLRCFDLSDNKMGDEGVRALMHSKTMPNLVSLDIRRNHVKSDGLYGIVNSNLLSQLRVLKMTIETPSHAWPYLFANGQALESLELEGSALGDDGLQALLDAPSPPRLVDLGLNWTGLTEEALVTLARSAIARQLGDLRIATREISNDGWATLAYSPLVDSLYSLDTNQAGSGVLQRHFGNRVT
jgi:uncharacterized protein (TIGR02996 family)